MHHRRKGIKGEQMLFIFAQTADRESQAFLLFGLKRRQVEQGLLFLLLLEDLSQFSADLFALAMRNGTQHIALFMDHTALPCSAREQRADSGQQPIMPIGDDEIELSNPALAHIL